MENLYKNEFFSIFYDKNLDLIVDVWTKETEKLNAKSFQNLLLQWLPYAKKHNARYALTDLVNFTFQMTPEIQKWTLKNITIPLFEGYNYRKHAFIMPTEFIANLAIELFAVETAQVAAETRYFADMTEARQWLLAS